MTPRGLLGIGLAVAVAAAVPVGLVVRDSQRTFTSVSPAHWQDASFAEPYLRQGGPPVVSPDGRLVTVHYLSGGCVSSAEAKVVETAALVQITVELTTEFRRDDICADIGLRRSITARLASALGDRALVDGSTG